MQKAEVTNNLRRSAIFVEETWTGEKNFGVWAAVLYCNILNFAQYLSTVILAHQVYLIYRSNSFPICSQWPMWWMLSKPSATVHEKQLLFLFCTQSYSCSWFSFHLRYLSFIALSGARNTNNHVCPGTEQFHWFLTSHYFIFRTAFSRKALHIGLMETRSALHDAQLLQIPENISYPTPIFWAAPA